MSNVNSQKVAQLLQAAFKRKKMVNSRYSRSSLARDLGVSSAFVTNLFTGKKFPPKNRIQDLARLLEMDINERNELVQAYSVTKESSDSYRRLLKQAMTSPSRISERRKVVGIAPSLLDRWYYLAVLEALATSFGSDEEQIASRLGISKKQMTEAVSILERLKMISSANGLWIKNQPHLFVSTGRSQKDIRHFHSQMITKAQMELTGKTLDADFHRRLITGFTFSLNRERLEKLKSRIQEFLSEIAEEATDGVCDDVYQMNLQFFPLSSGSQR